MANEKQTEAEKNATKVVTSKVRFSYAHVWEPAGMADGSGVPKYSVSIIIPKKDTALIAKIKAAVEAAKEQGKAKKFGGKLPATLKLPLRDGDIDRPDDAAYKDSFFITASSKTRPGIVDAARNEILTQSEFYSGCYGKASINFYAFNTSGSKGIACGLNNLQKLEDGEPLAGRSSAEDDFAEEDDNMLG